MTPPAQKGLVAVDTSEERIGIAVIVYAAAVASDTALQPVPAVLKVTL